MLKILKYIGKLFYPSRCPMCGKITKKDYEICDNCKPSAIEITPPTCKRCGCKKEDCNCRERRFIFAAVVAPYYYDGSVKFGVRRFKYKENSENSSFLIQKTIKCIKSEYSGYNIDIVTYIPMHKDDIKKRKFNPARVLANKIAAELNIPCCDALTKLYKNKKQHSLGMEERAGNVLGVYGMNPSKDIKDKTVLLCDDIVTTGATLDECAKVLYFAGAKTVICACIAKTPPHKKISKKHNY